MGAITDLLTNYQHIIGETIAINGSKGIFDVIVDGDMLYSKVRPGDMPSPVRYSSYSPTSTAKASPATEPRSGRYWSAAGAGSAGAGAAVVAAGASVGAGAAVVSGACVVAGASVV